MSESAGAAVAVLAVVVFLNQVLGFVSTYWIWILSALVLLVVCMSGNWQRRRTTSRGLVTRWSARSRRRHGVASTLDIVRVASSVAVRRKATTVRPSLEELTRRERLRVPTTQVAVQLCRVGVLRVWASTEDVVTVFGGPRVGKTGWLASAIIDASGAVLTTSTRLDLWDLTATLRANGDRPVFMFNPGGVGDLASTVSFNPLLGCDDPVTATERASDMIPEGSAGDAERWDTQARRVLAMLLHTAALGRVPVTVVAEWVADPEASEREVLAGLRRSPDASYVEMAKQFLHTNDRTRSSITASIMPALAWLTNPTALAAATGPNQLDIPALLEQRGTVYLLGRHEAHTGPLLGALTGHIARTARRLAATQPGGRLDPPLTLALDEAARVAPVPLPDWSGDMGGSGVCIIAAFQSRADMIDRWNKTGAAKILNNSGSIVVFGGTKDGDDLEAWSKLTGERDEPTGTPDKFGRTHSKDVRKVPVLSAAQIANLPARRVLVICRGMPPAIGRVRMAWTRWDVRRAKKLSYDTAATAANLGVATPIHQPITQPVVATQTGVNT